MQVYIIFNNFHPFDIAFRFHEYLFYLSECVYANILSGQAAKKKKTFGHFLTQAIFISYLLFWMHYNHIYYLSFERLYI